VSPPVDVFENADEVLVIADVPGFGTDTVDVRIENDTLSIETKRQQTSEARALAREYEVVDFARSFRIPGGIDLQAITAEAKHGTLVIRLPKAAAAKARKIAVRAS
jgi:HSP20 family molecular chaperone IbpA